MRFMYVFFSPCILRYLFIIKLSIWYFNISIKFFSLNPKHNSTESQNWNQEKEQTIARRYKKVSEQSYLLYITTIPVWARAKYEAT